MKIDSRSFRWFAALALFVPLVSGTAQRPKLPTVPPTTQVSGSGSNPAVPPSAAAELTTQDLDAFLDGVVPLQLKRENIAGAVVIVVKDGKVLYARGYGYSDVKARKPVTTDATLFRPGSVSKLYTWTAVMQMVEQGKIDLDRNVNDYLDFKIPDTYPQPITMRNLMTHTAGFQEAIQGLMTGDAKNIPTVGEYLKSHLPERVFPPGQTSAYSNYGATLAGYIVQRVSGVPFNEYIEKNIFQPLAMPHSTFRQPLPGDLQPLMSNGYKVASGKPQPFEIVIPAPAGSLSSTAEDMSHFMFAQLQGGQYNGARILKPETIALMHTRQQYGENPATSGMCLGFYEESRNGHRIIGHAGDTNYFHSDLHLMQDANLGFFVSYNSAGKGEISPRTALWDQFLDRYFPYKVPAAAPVANTQHDAKMVAGQYIGSRGAFTDIFSFLGFVGQLTVSAKPDGTIVTDDLKTLAGQPREWKEIAPLVYRSINGQSLLAFQRNAHGDLRGSIDFPFEVFDRASFLKSKSFNMFLLTFISIVTFLALISWPIAAWIRRHYHRPLALTQRQRWFYAAIRIVCFLDLAFFLSWAFLLTAIEKNPLSAGPGLDPFLYLIQLIGWLGSLGALVVLYSVFQLRTTENRWWLSQLGYAAVALACVGFSWLLLYWHMLQFSIKF